MRTVEELFMEQNIAIVDIVTKFGVDHQIDKSIEEMAELTKALLKHRTGHGSYGEVCEEIADVMIMLHQLSDFYSEDNHIDKYLNLKVERFRSVVHG